MTRAVLSLLLVLPLAPMAVAATTDGAAAVDGAAAADPVLDHRLAVDFQDNDVTETLAFVCRLVPKLAIVVSPRAGTTWTLAQEASEMRSPFRDLPPVTIAGQDLTVRAILDAIAKQSHTPWRRLPDGSIVVGPTVAKIPPAQR